MSKTKKESKKPSGLKTTRAVDKFTFEWKTHNYEKQTLQWDVLVNDGTRLDVFSKKPSIAKNASSKKVTISAEDYYPTTETILKGIQFRVRGTSKDTDKFNFTESDWAKSEMFDIFPPPSPTSITVEQNSSYTLTFTIKIDNHVNDKGYWGLYVEFNTCLVIDSGYREPTETEWAAGTVYREKIRNSITDEDKKEFLYPVDDSTSAAMISQNDSVVRWFRARVIGPGGDSNWTKQKFSYSKAKRSENITATIVKNGNSDYTCSVSWTMENSVGNPIDQATLEYTISGFDSDLVPEGTGWTPAELGGSNAIIPSEVIGYYSGPERINQYSPRNIPFNNIKFPIRSQIGKDQLVFVRVNTVNNGQTTEGEPVLVLDSNGHIPNQTSVLSPPNTPEVEHTTGNLVKVTVNNTCTIDGAFLTVDLITNGTDANGVETPVTKTLGIIPLEGTGDVFKLIQFPPECLGANAIPYSISIRAVVGTYDATPSYIGEGSDQYEVYTVTPVLTSDACIVGDIQQTPERPTVTNLSDGNVRVSWKWSWSDAILAEVAWSDYELAMESNDEPQTFEVNNTKMSSVVIRGLEAGKQWYFWVRLLNKTSITDWSEAAAINLTSAPNVSQVSTSKPWYKLDEDVLVQWTYVTTDTTEQASAILAQVVEENGETTYRTIKRIPNDDQPNATDQFTTFKPSELGWEAGHDYKLSVKVSSKSGIESESWAEPVSITIPEPISCEITTHPFVQGDDPDFLLLELHSLPMTVEVSGVEAGMTASLYITRYGNYFIDRPDDGVYGGYDGETVYTSTGSKTGIFTISQDDLTRRHAYLDDGADYYLTAYVEDEYGQTESDTIEFRVKWDHQAVEPEVEMRINQNEQLVFIKILEPQIEGWTADPGDRCDIYRHSVDGYELVMPNAVFGNTYVDQFPTIGQHGGHRIVYKTYNGDYITAEDTFAFLDVEPEDGDIFKSDVHLINFGRDVYEASMNTDLSSTFKKDFQTTRYLGGSIEGDWNAGIEMTGSVNTNMITSNIEEIEKLHALARHEGPCRIRTTAGQNYIANVDVSENISHDTYYDPEGNFTKLGSYSMNITRVGSPVSPLVTVNYDDTDALTGSYTLTDWYNATPIILKNHSIEALLMPDDRIVTLVQPEGE